MALLFARGLRRGKVKAHIVDRPPGRSAIKHLDPKRPLDRLPVDPARAPAGDGAVRALKCEAGGRLEEPCELGDGRWGGFRGEERVSEGLGRGEW